MPVIKEVIESVKKSRDNEFHIDIESLMLEVGMQSNYYDFRECEKRLRAYFAYSHICGDTEVGFAVWFLDGKFLCTTTQRARKDHVNFQWYDEEEYNRAQMFIMELTKEELSGLHDINDDLFEIYETKGPHFLDRNHICNTGSSDS